MQYDLVIIGSGVAGLTAGIIAARKGRAVLVLEQARQPGGLMRSFQRMGSVYPVGVHRLGGLAPGQNLWCYLSYLGVLNRLRLVPMDQESFEEYRFPGESFGVPCGVAAYEQRLLDHCPSEAPAIRAFVENMRQVTSHFPLYNLDSGEEDISALLAAEPLGAYIDRLTGSARLKAILTAPNPLYGVQPSDCPLFVHFLVVHSFLQSAWRIDESETVFADVFADVYREAGGELRCNSRAAAIEMNDAGVCAVRLADGERIETHNVVFTGHPRQLLDLCPEAALRPAYRARLANLPDTASVFGLALQWDHIDSRLPDRDIFAYTSWDTQEQYSLPPLSTGGGPCMFYVSALNGPDGAQAAEVLVPAPLAEWQEWAGSAHGARPAGYEAAKERIAQRLLSRLATLWPPASGARVVDTFTPLTMRDYTLAPDGTVYGVKKSAAQARSILLSPRVRAPGLFLAGQSIVLPGMLGALISGINGWRALARDEHLVAEIREYGK